EAAASGRDWLVGMVAVKTALAGWVLVTRATFGVRRRSELGGWARGAPLLGVTFVLILIGAIGVPGMATFEARGALTGAALDAPFDLFVLVAAFAPAFYLGRLLVAGLGPMSEPVREAATGWPGAAAPARRLAGFRGYRPGGWSSMSPVGAARATPDAVRANRFALAAGAALLLAAVGLSVATTGVVGPSGDQQPAGGPAASAPAGSE
ncbi:MAG: hypothetical protein ABIV26_00350, partial [Candidatus Limnocylindrales bacterium]